MEHLYREERLLKNHPGSVDENIPGHKIKSINFNLFILYDVTNYI